MNKINLATKLTLSRILLVPFFMIFMFVDNIWTRIFALLIFILCGLTDMFDGIIARRFNIVTKFGIFLDPLADKLIISAALISFVGLREINVPAWMVVLIISREFLITGLRLLALSHGRTISADKTGKFKTTSQIVAIIIILVILTLSSFFSVDTHPSLHQSFKIISFWIMFYITILTLFSGITYLYKHRDIIALDLG